MIFLNLLLEQPPGDGWAGSEHGLTYLQAREGMNDSGLPDRYEATVSRILPALVCDQREGGRGTSKRGLVTLLSPEAPAISHLRHMASQISRHGYSRAPDLLIRGPRVPRETVRQPLSTKYMHDQSARRLTLKTGRGLPYH